MKKAPKTTKTSLADFTINYMRNLYKKSAVVSKLVKRRTKFLVRRFSSLPLYAKLFSGGVLMLLIMILGLQLRHYQLYAVSDASRELLSKSSVEASLIKVSGKTVSYDASSQKPSLQKDVTIAAPTDATGKTGYQATINTDFQKGLTFGDSNSQLSFQMTPLFDASGGQYSEGQIMFPVSTSIKIFQTFKKNGIKEDIVLTTAPGKTATWQWKLGLGDKLSAKLLPDGSVGIYGANPYLYGNIQINDAKSQALIDKARTTDKTYLVFAIPAPVILDALGHTLQEDVSFSLSGNTLTLEARNLITKHYPISIDPSVIITTTADFATNYSGDGMVDYGTADQIGRSAVGLGTVGAVTQQTNTFTTPRYLHSSMVYNGYLYVIGGRATASATGCDANGFCNDVQHCPINSDGSVGTCVQQLTAFTTTRYGQTSLAYNGYLYVIGGCISISATCSGAQNDIQHCPINSDGSVGTCVQQTAAFTTTRWSHTSVAYNGYLYVIGGCTGYPGGLVAPCTAFANDIQHCPINSDGSVGTCVQQTAAFTTTRWSHTSVAYNGYLYVIGGCTGVNTSSCTSFANDIQHCPINSDGSVGTCVQQTAAFTTARYGHTSVAYNGYLYVAGGCSAGSCGTYQNDIQHCPINSDGSVGTCVQQTAAFTTARYGHTSVAYNGYLYVAGGTSGTNQNDVQYLPITAGTPTGLGAVGATTQQAAALGSGTANIMSVAYNGYLYTIGGNYSTSVRHCPINTDGSIGTCIDQSTALNNGLSYHGVAVYNGYLYTIGGNNGTSYLNEIEHCPINTDGSVGTCVTQNALNTIWARGGTAIYNGYLYIVGGSNNTTSLSDIEYCPINTDGSVGTCVTQTNALVTARSDNTAAAYNGYLYSIGGNSTVVEHCPINTDGSVGTCVQQTGTFTTARYWHSTVTYNGYLYIIGGAAAASAIGCDSGGKCNDIQHCPINADGSIGTCVQQLTAFTNARYGFGAAVYNGYLYLAGGYSTIVGYESDVQHLPILSQAQSAHYERMIDIGVVANSIDYIRYNGSAKCGTQLQYATADGSGVFGAYTTAMYDAAAGTTYNISGLTNKRYVRVIVTLNDQVCGATTTVTDVTVGYSLTPPAAPTLSAPTSGATSVSVTPLFQLETTHATSTYAQYKILVYQSDCSTLVRTIDQTASQTGWSGQDAQTATAYVLGATLGASTLASHTYQAAALSSTTTYCWKGAAINPADSNVFGAYSATQLFTTGVANWSPATPTLSQPASGQTGVSITPEFRFYSIDQDNDYVRYKILVYQSDCSTLVSTIDQTASQAGWLGQSQQSATAYSSGQTAIYDYASTPLTINTTYCWKAQAIDPAGTNLYGSFSTTSLFTTQTSATPNNILLNGNINIKGNTTIHP